MIARQPFYYSQIHLVCPSSIFVNKFFQRVFEAYTMTDASPIALGPPIKNGKSAVLHRDLHKHPYLVVSASGLYLTLSNGRQIIDASGGAAVSCIGHGDERIGQVIASQVTKLDYCHSLFFSCDPSENLSRALIDSTDGAMARVFIVNSGKIQA